MGINYYKKKTRNRMKIGIIEDEAVHMQILNRYIKNWGVERKENIQIKEYDSA